MSPEAQRIAIAEACGWTDIAYRMTPSGEFRQLWAKNKKGKYFHLPDYLHDLNAMHEAESFLTVVQIPIWFEHLRKICPEGTYGPYDTAFWITHSTAAQRAEAFLKTVGKWDDLK